MKYEVAGASHLILHRSYFILKKAPATSYFIAHTSYLKKLPKKEGLFCHRNLQQTFTSIILAEQPLRLNN
jgi:hypothetical protein